MKGLGSNQSRADSILDAADRLLARYGYRKMTVDDLAREAGIGKGTVYLHFKSKEDVVLSHMDRIVQRVIERLKAVARSDDSAASKLRQMLISRVMLRIKSVQHYTEEINEILRTLRLQVANRRREHFAREAQIFAEVLANGQRVGEFRQHNAKSVARVLLSATNSLLPASLSKSELRRLRGIELLASETAELLIQGLATQTSRRR